MELTVLCDNNTLIDRYFLGEPGLSFFIEDNDTRVLFDCGYSDVFIKNARKAGINLLNLDYIVLSHGHLDHTWGLQHLITLYLEAETEDQPRLRPKLIAHPDVFCTRAVDGLDQIGSLLTPEKLESHFPLQLSKDPVRLNNNLIFLGEIPRTLKFEDADPVGERYAGGAWIEDTLPDDSALAWTSDTGLVLITGCAHSGVCNTVRRAQQVCGTERVRSIIGGTHLLETSPERLQQTADFLANLELESLYACHCTDLTAKMALAARNPVRETGSGARYSF